jgi:predicted DNA-binding protein
MMKERLKPYSVPISEQLKQDLETLAANDSRPAANYVRRVLEDHVQKFRARKPELFEGREEAKQQAA